PERVGVTHVAGRPPVVLAAAVPGPQEAGEAADLLRGAADLRDERLPVLEPDVFLLGPVEQHAQGKVRGDDPGLRHRDAGRGELGEPVGQAGDVHGVVPPGMHSPRAPPPSPHESTTLPSYARIVSSAESGSARGYGS